MPSNRDLQPMLDVRQNQLNVVFAESDSIDTKALAILGANVAIVLFVGTLQLAVWKLLPLYATFTVSLVLDLFSVWPQAYLGMSVDINTHPEYLRMDKSKLILQLLADTEDAIVKNSRLNKKRTRFCIISIILTGLGFFALLFIL